VGETWSSPSGDPCQTYICLEGSDGTIIKQLQIESCPNCPSVRFNNNFLFVYSWFHFLFFLKGWEYQTANASVCCGTCQQVACVSADGSQHAIGSTWKADLCTKISCVLRDNGVMHCLFRIFFISFINLECLTSSYKWKAWEKTAINQPTKINSFTITKQLHRLISAAPFIKERLVYITAKHIRWKSQFSTNKKTTCYPNYFIIEFLKQVNDTWSTNDQCVTMVCSLQADGQVARQEVMLSCPPASDCLEVQYILMILLK
jgi:hypothetical protein